MEQWQFGHFISSLYSEQTHFLQKLKCSHSLIGHGMVNGINVFVCVGVSRDVSFSQAVLREQCCWAGGGTVPGGGLGEAPRGGERGAAGAATSSPVGPPAG